MSINKKSLKTAFLRYCRKPSKKSSFVFMENVNSMIRRFGANNVGFLTLTFEKGVSDPREASRRFNNLNRRVLKKYFKAGIFVKEQHRNGNIHFHGIVALDFDIRTKFNFKQVKKRNYSSASLELKSLWLNLRTILPRYGFGRHELMPVKSELAIAKYLTKYLSKAYYLDCKWKGVRLVSYINSKTFRTHRLGFSWAKGARTWRKFLSMLGKLFKVNDLSILGLKLIPILRFHFGFDLKTSKWAYWLLEFIKLECNFNLSNSYKLIEYYYVRYDIK